MTQIALYLVLQYVRVASLQMYEDGIQVLLYSCGRLDMSPYSSRSCRMRFMVEKAALKLPDSLQYKGGRS